MEQISLESLQNEMVSWLRSKYGPGVSDGDERNLRRALKVAYDTGVLDERQRRLIALSATGGMP